MTKVLIGFVGGRGSGKSAVSRAVSLRLRCKRVSFGDFVRREVSQRGLADDLDTLQALGQWFVDNDVEQFCRGTLAQGSGDIDESIVVDGIRHLIVWETLTKLVEPAPTLLVYLEGSVQTRSGRVASRDGSRDGTSTEFTRFDQHETEIQVFGVLRDRADVLVDAEVSLGEVIKTVLRGIATLSAQRGDPDLLDGSAP